MILLLLRDALLSRITKNKFSIALTILMIFALLNTGHYQIYSGQFLAEPTPVGLGEGSFDRLEAQASSINPALGNQNVIFVFVEFTNTKHSVPITSLTDQQIRIMERYYSSVSYNKVNLNTTILDKWIMLPNTLSSYGADGTGRRDVNIYNLFYQAVQLIDNEVDFSKYRHVVLVHAGNDQAMVQVTSNIWSAYYRGLQIRTNDGYVLDSAVIISEKTPVGGFVHEFGHSLGLLDLYGPNSNTIYTGDWSVMGEGLWLGDGYNPPNMLAAEKNWLGWLDNDKIVNLKRGTILNLTLGPLSISNPFLALVKIEKDDQTYYSVEYRARQGEDKYLPGEGLIISQVNETITDGPIRVIDSRPETRTLNDSELNTIERNFRIPSQDIVVKLIKISNVSSTVQVQNGLADLTSDKIAWKGQLRIGSEIVFEAQVKNVGETMSTFSDIRLAVDDTTIDSLGISSISSEGLMKISFKPWLALVGEHIVSVQLDTENSIMESNESNNILSEKISVTNQRQAVIIDKSYVSSSHVDVNSSQKVFFHASNESGEHFTTGLVFVNQTGFKPNATGWITIDVKSSNVGKKTWIITGVNDDGTTKFDQTAPSPIIIWDKVAIYLFSPLNHISTNSKLTISSTGVYVYSGEQFKGDVTFNDTLIKNKVGRYNYKVVNINDAEYGLTKYDSNVISAIFDKVDVTLSLIKPRIEIGGNVSVTFVAKYSFDGLLFNGSVRLNDTTSKSKVGSYKYTVSKIIDNHYSLEDFSSNTVTAVFDIVKISLSAEKDRVDVNSKANLRTIGEYLYDGEPFKGEITFDSNLTKSEVGIYRFGVYSIEDPLFGLSKFESNEVYVVYDRVLVDLNSPSRFEIGTSANINFTAKYEYDSSVFEGHILLNDSTIKRTISRIAYTVSEINDTRFGLIKFKSNKIFVIFDSINIGLDVNANTPFTFNVRIRLSSEFDGSPIKGKVRINDNPSVDICSGVYEYESSSFYLTQSLLARVNVDGFKEVESKTTVNHLGNIGAILLLTSGGLVLIFLRRQKGIDTSAIS